MFFYCMSSNLSRQNNLYSIGFTKDPLNHLRKFNVDNLPIKDNDTKFDGLWLLNNLSNYREFEKETYIYFYNECKIMNNNYTKWYIVTLDIVLKFVESKLQTHIIRSYLPDELTNIYNKVCEPVVASMVEETSQSNEGSHLCQICVNRQNTEKTDIDGWIQTIFDQFFQIKSELIRIYKERILSVYFIKKTPEKTIYSDFTEWNDDLETGSNITV